MANKKDSTPEPSQFGILFVYILLGCLISFSTGREPGTLPDEILFEVAPTIVVISAFLVSYSVWDVMAVGLAKARHGVFKSYKDLPNRMPEEVFLAQRVQTNQVEQLPVFLVGILACAVLVNGTVAAVLGSIWAMLRRMYASVYRNSVGIPFADIGLQKYTIPCYFISNSMLMAAAVQSIRHMIQVLTVPDMAI